MLEGRALFYGPEREVYVRLAEFEDSTYLDLANDNWEAVKITAEGWEVVSDLPVYFKRPRGLSWLPHPARDGSIQDLRDFLTVEEADWPLLIGFIIAALRPSGPYPVLNLLGQQGSAKSTTARMIRALIDPNVAGLRAEPREVRDLMIAANNSGVVTWDNISRLPNWLSDAVCRLATGGGFATRELYSDAEEILFDFQRLVVLNGITDVATRGDLLERSLLVYLPPIAEDKRRTEADMWAEFHDAAPRMLGALLDAVVVAKERLSSVKLERLPRMADLAQWVTAAEPALGLHDGQFLGALAKSIEAANQIALEAAPIALVLQGFVAERGQWEGTASELLGALTDRSDDADEADERGTRVSRGRDWPKTAQAFGYLLRRIAPNLEAQGVRVRFRREGTGRTIVLEQKDGGR